ncbi:MAG: RNA pyrophosphohydrolase [Akkermansiaceae bacterium]|jgi:putative (di)nucleoside polyphosphate hydrolase|tara:strand:- start:5152 stop:5622 length:471 start_codon:yes stop_codon:yes gene_type:complete
MALYRSNVAALVVNPSGQILVCERFKIPGSWQFPQGGVDEGEEIERALVREIEEEIGLGPEAYEVSQSKGGYRYVYPDNIRKGKPSHKNKFVGQEQTYFLCRVQKDHPELNLMREPREFSRSRWIHPEEFKLAWLPAFKREVYEAVMKDFFGVDLS